MSVVLSLSLLLTNACASHLAARFRAPATRLGTALAVTRVVLGTFLAAGVADFRTKRTDSFGEFGAACHFVSREGADVRAAPIEFDAAREHFYIVFLQAGARTVFARGEASLTGIDTVLIFVVSHNDSLSLMFG